MAFNAQGSAEAPLSVYGGLVTEMAPPNVPEGVSPDCQDVVFAPGEVGSRPATKKVFAAPFASPTVSAKSFVNPDPIGTYAGTQNLYLDAAGNLWVELISAPGVKNLIASGLTPNSYMKSVTAFNREYIAITDGLHGSDVPLQWDGTNLDRVTRDAAAAPPTVTNLILAGAAITSITRVGNVVTVDTGSAHNLKVGYQTILANIAATQLGGGISSIVIDNENLPGIATVNTNSAHGLVPGNFVTLAGINAVAVPGCSPPAAIFRHSDIVTIVTSVPHGLGSGAFITVFCTADTSFNATYPVTVVGPNTLSMPGVAVDSNPSAGGTTVILNWPLPATSTPSFFQVQTCPTSTSFQVQILYCDGTWTSGTVSIPWDGTFFVQSVISPTSFTYQSYGPPVSATISSGETSTPFGQASPGLHQVQLLFQDRSGGISAPSPPVNFEANGGQYLSISNIALGPPTTVARILAFTGALGSQFFYIPVPAQEQGQVVSTATQIQDNTTASIVLDFSDNTLFGSIGISIPGNNLARQIVIEGALGFGYFGGRLATWGQRNRIQSLLSMSFDGGFLSGQTVPLGWNSSASIGGALAPGHFGLGWQITLAGSGTQGKLSQPMYQDYNGAPIAQPNTFYKFRGWFKLGASATDVVFDAVISSASTGFSSSALIAIPPGASAAGVWLEAQFSAETPITIPSDLILTISATATSATTTLLVDEMSIIYSENPYTDRIFNMSYVGSPEAFDGVTGRMGSTDDTHKVMGMAQIRDIGYALTQDPGGRLHEFINNGTTEPVGWTFGQVETSCGLISVFALAVSQADSGTASGGEQWFAWSSCDGARIFGGGTGYKISQEIQPDWTGAKEAGASQWSKATGLNPAALTQAWVLNDPKSRVLYFGLPVLSLPV